MKLSDVTVYKRREFYMMSPFTIKINPSNKTQSFLLKLINDPFFIKNLAELRLKYNIPENGFPTKLLDNYKQRYDFVATPEEMEEFKMVHGTYDIEPLWKNMKEDMRKLVEHYKYYPSFAWLFFLLITHNAFIEFNPKENVVIEYESGVDKLISFIKGLKDPIAAILIKSNITKNDLKKWIDDNWDEVNVQGELINIGFKNDLEKIMPKIPNERGTLKNLAIDEEIINLLTKGKTNTYIGKRLIELFPDEDKVFGQDWVNLHISRLKKRLKKL